MTFNHVMCDIESTGTSPDHSAMIQLSAVRFDFDERKIDMKFFDECLAIPSNRYWMEDTREWWASQDQAILNKIWGRMREPGEVLREFREWAVRDLDEAPILFAKPISFEWPFLQSYFREYGVAMPFHYSDAKDLRSILWAWGLPGLDREIPFTGDAHNAIYDVLHQIQVLFEAADRI